MEKQKRWQLYLIVCVIFLTLYNILPTVFYYSKPLRSPIDKEKSERIATSIIQRVNGLEQQSLDWVSSFCKLLKIKPLKLNLLPENPELINVCFSSKKDADLFKLYLPRAGSLISFSPAQLTPFEGTSTEKEVLVKRKIPIHFDPADVNSFFQYSSKVDSSGCISPLYQALTNDRILELALSLAGVNENAQYVQALNTSKDDAYSLELAIQLSQNLTNFTKVFGENNPIATRFFASFTQTELEKKSDYIQSFIAKLEQVKEKNLSDKKKLLNSDIPSDIQNAALLDARDKVLNSAILIVKKNQSIFEKSTQPLDYNSILTTIQKNLGSNSSIYSSQFISLENKNAFFDKITIDWKNEKIIISFHDDIIKKLEQLNTNSTLLDQAEQILFNQIAFVSRQSGENIKPTEKDFEINLSEIAGSKSFLAFKLGAIAASQAKEMQQAILNSWHPSHPDLVADAFPMWNYETYCKLPLEQKKLGLLIYAPVTSSKNPERGFKMNAVYVVAKGMGKILKKYEQNPDSESAKLFFEDFYKLNLTLQKYGYVGFPGTALGYNKEFSEDFIFEASDYFKSVLSATRENFEVFGTKRYAVLEFSDTEQRILTENKIDSKIHEDLLRWRDDYRAAQLKAKGSYKFDIPKPTRSPLLSNLALSTLKYFRGDERKILHWGLDLSGGKTVQIELKDNNNRTVTKEADIKQGINELYKRVNKMGVSEVSIRQEGHHITLDFPGSQNLTAADLVKASSMFFNVINEQFSTSNKLLSDSVNRFLQDVWNEAVVTNKKSVDEINFIAWRHLYGDALSSETAQPRTDAAKFLHENGLQLSNPQEPMTSSAFDTQFSKIALLRGEDYTHWQGQTHPLMIVFSNYALEGSNIDDVRASYDPSKGNFLSFSVKNSSSSRSADSYNPRDQFFNWTSSFSKESPSTNSSLALNRGWRMAVILNGSIVSAPTLDSALRESAMISGSFSQREVNQLEADLKAGSLTFTPKILSEKNVSPELGKQERYLGIFATIIALILVIATMVGYYRFGGLVASVAVVFNLLIMWATLQNIQATLTLPMIAGLILTVGMAVDANVLVFERIREEFSISGRIASAIHAGYKKAFSAILDSNVTTVIAGLVLLQFDSGPIKGFALTLIIGIASSMFTALFMTKFFFARWIENPANKKLTMMNLFKAKKFDFLKWTKTALIASAIFILAGIACFVSQKQTIMGMDFTGGYALNLEINSGSEVDYRNIVENALIKEGVLSQDFQIRELNPSNHIRLFLSNTLENAGKAFYGMAPSQSIINAAYPGENPRINWIVSALEKNGVMLDPTSLNHLDSNWAEISGQMSETMRDNAIIGLAIALVGILLYITIRFEFKYAISATLCLAHDIVFTIGAIAMLHALGVSVQIDLNIIAALMTIVGYSLNDTIIVFDRIREDVRLMKNTSFSEIINHSLNVTLSRTLMTSGTTLLVLVPLVLLGGSTILGFSLVMAIGVIFGTLSSLFIAAPLMLYFHRRETDKNKNNAIKTV